MPDALGCSICPFSEGLDLLAHGAHAQHICTTGWCCSLEVGRAQQQLHDPLRRLARDANTVVSGCIDWKNGWSGMYNFASGSSPRTMRSKSSNVSFGHGLFPQGGSLAECAKGSYDDEQREVARRLAANGVGDAEIRLGWEASGDWFPWSAAGKPADQWKACFTHVAKAMKGAAPAACASAGSWRRRAGSTRARSTRRCADHQHRPELLRRRAGPVRHRDLSRRSVGLSGMGQLRARQGQEAGVRGVGCRPQAVTTLRLSRICTTSSPQNSAVIAHEAYFNSGSYQLYPIKSLPKSSSEYQKKF